MKQPEYGSNMAGMTCLNIMNYVRPDKTYIVITVKKEGRLLQI